MSLEATIEMSMVDVLKFRNCQPKCLDKHCRLKKQSDPVLPCLLFWQAFCEFQLITNILSKTRKSKVFEILEDLP